ncbi:MAG: proteasome-type protease [Thermostichales cyanobacterium HHBFW_bins_127]
MTYCLGILTAEGLLMAADSRTNAGVDHISTYNKLFDFSVPGERVLVLCTAGNLSTTQSLVIALQQDIKHQRDPNLHILPTLYDCARYVGEKARIIQDQDREWLKRDGIDGQCTLLLGGQLPDGDPELYLIYAQGNCIQATPETPFLQIGEIKYGKPILDRTLSFETTLEDAAKCALLSIDSTMKSNISVGPPIDMILMKANTFRIRHRLRLKGGDPYLDQMRQSWEQSLKQAFERLPAPVWQEEP